MQVPDAIHLALDWPDTDPRWKVLEATYLWVLPRLTSTYNLCRYPVYWDEAEQRLMMFPHDGVGRQYAGILSFKPDYVRQLVGVKKLTREHRIGRETTKTLDQAILNLSAPAPF